MTTWTTLDTSDRVPADPPTLTTPEARALAAQYQSSGSVGSTFASFASGRAVSYERFVSECDMTATECGFEAHADMAALRQYAGDTADAVWSDL